VDDSPLLLKLRFPIDITSLSSIPPFLTSLRDRLDAQLEKAERGWVQSQGIDRVADGDFLNLEIHGRDVECVMEILRAVARGYPLPVGTNVVRARPDGESGERIPFEI
jgi:hypothetical protein